MRDCDIRSVLKIEIEFAHPCAAIFDEFPVCRKGRADVVAVNAALRGYEIKSERDSLARLPLQIERYDCIFDFCTIVAAERHLKQAGKIVPEHWGIFVANGTASECSIVELRAPAHNPNRQREHIIRILWKTEWIKTLRDRGIEIRSGASVRKVWNALQSFSITDLAETVRRALKARNSTQFGVQQTLGDDSHTIAPIA